MTHEKWRCVLRTLVPVFFSPQELHTIETNMASDPSLDEDEDVVSPEDHPLTLARYFKHFLVRPSQVVDNDWANVLDRRLVNSWKLEVELPRDDCLFPHYNRSNKLLKVVATSGYRIGEGYLCLPGNAPRHHFRVTVLGATRNNDVSVVLRVRWKGEMWWLKLGAEAGARHKALQAPDELPTGGWERWFQTERDMLSRALLATEGSSEAFAVVVEAGRTRPAMLVKDAGDSLEKGLLMHPAEVYDMSRQLYAALEASGKRGVFHGDVCLENICEKNGVYSLIDWGLACGRPFEDLAAAVGKAWPDLDVMNQAPGIPNWEMSPRCYFLGVRTYSTEHDL